MINHIGVIKIPKPVPVSIPPTAPVPIAWSPLAPAPVAITNGIRPRMKAKDVINIGRSLACEPAMAASSPFPIQAPGAGPTALRTFAGRSAPTPTWRCIHFRSGAPSTRPRPRRVSLTQTCPTPPNSRRLTIRAALAGARGKRGLKRWPTRKRGMATRSTTSW